MSNIDKTIGIVSHTYIFTWLEAIKELADNKTITGEKAQLIAKNVLEKALDYLDKGKIKDYKEFIVQFGQEDKKAINHLVKTGIKKNFLEAIAMESEDSDDNSNFWS